MRAPPSARSRQYVRDRLRDRLMDNRLSQAYDFTVFGAASYSPPRSKFEPRDATPLPGEFQLSVSNRVSKFNARLWRIIMKRISIPMLFTTCIALTAWPQAQPPSKRKIITFNVKGAGTGVGQGTIGRHNRAGVIQGSYIDSNNVYHPFLRAPDGALTKINISGTWTYASSINVAARSRDTTSMATCITVSCELPTVPSRNLVFGAGKGAQQGTFAVDINPKGGEVAGEYQDANNVYHGFLRNSDGTITKFDVPGAGKGGASLCLGNCLNPAGTVTGWYLDSNNAAHSFLRTRDGTITKFDVPGAGKGAHQGTVPVAINPAGAIAGAYADSNNVFHGFLRMPDGTITKINVPGAGKGSGQGTFACPGTSICIGGINAAGAISGNYIDSSNVNHGFLRMPDGTITKFDVPGAGKGSGQGTIPYGINPEGAITGWYIDSGGVSHGFLRK